MLLDPQRFHVEAAPAAAYGRRPSTTMPIAREWHRVAVSDVCDFVYAGRHRSGHYVVDQAAGPPRKNLITVLASRLSANQTG